MSFLAMGQIFPSFGSPQPQDAATLASLFPRGEPPPPLDSWHRHPVVSLLSRLATFTTPPPVHSTTSQLSSSSIHLVHQSLPSLSCSRTLPLRSGVPSVSRNSTRPQRALHIPLHRHKPRGATTPRGLTASRASISSSFSMARRHRHRQLHTQRRRCKKSIVPLFVLLDATTNMYPTSSPRCSCLIALLLFFLFHFSISPCSWQTETEWCGYVASTLSTRSYAPPSRTCTPLFAEAEGGAKGGVQEEVAPA